MKQKIIYINFKKFMTFLSLKEIVTNLHFF